MDLPRSQTMSDAYASVYGEGFKPFPKAKVQDKAAMKPDTARGEKQARNMDNARIAHTDKDIAPIAKGAVKEREQDNKKTGLEKRFAAPSAKKNKNKAYELEGQRRRDLDKRYGTKKEEYLAMRDMYSSVYSEQSVETPVVNETVENDDEVTYLDVVANHLFEGGYALNGESAYAMANHISEDYFNQICEDLLGENNARGQVGGGNEVNHGLVVGGGAGRMGSGTPAAGMGKDKKVKNNPKADDKRAMTAAEQHKADRKAAAAERAERKSAGEEKNPLQAG